MTSEVNHQVLARKYRPSSFETLVGQEHVVRALVNALDKSRLHHAYLFTGTRGVGKTTIARIIAKCLNCETGVSSKPCGKCDACQAIDNGNFVDLIEVDAASRTKVEDTRDLLDNVQYLPARGRYKIYIIDEVHMLSGHSFNALLKTLEEPPKHVKFLLATTDPQKLPVTVLSRCLQFHLKNLSPEKIADYLQFVLDQENIAHEQEALQNIARAANGSMRDALSLLDQAIAFSQNNVTTIDVNAMLGTVDQNYIQKILHALAEKNAKNLLGMVNQLAELAADFSNVLEELISFLHKIAISQIIPETAAPEITEFCQLFTKEDVQLYYQIALIGRRDLVLIADAKSGFEMILLRMLAFCPASLVKQSRTQQTKTSMDPAVKPRDDMRSIDPAVQPQNDQPISRDDTYQTINNWADFITQLQLTGMTYALASNCVLKTFDKNQIELFLNKKHAALLNNNLKERLHDAIKQKLNHEIKLSIKLEDTKEKTPAELAQHQADNKHQAAVETILQDPNVQAMVKQFGAVVEPNLINTE
ncbi:MAG: DNA polymerase III subunit gamma/tau [Gammaproteobacteria bacterium]|jgi:DNA polymerase-3 subunit gamma/tau